MSNNNHTITYSDAPENAAQYVYHNGNEIGHIDYIPPMLTTDKPYHFIWDPDACIPHGISLNLLTDAPTATRAETQKIINDNFAALPPPEIAKQMQPDLTLQPCAPDAPSQEVKLKNIVIGHIYRFPRAGVGCTFGFVALGGAYAKEQIRQIDMVSASCRTEMQARLQQHFPIWNTEKAGTEK